MGPILILCITDVIPLILMEFLVIYASMIRESGSQTDVGWGLVNSEFSALVKHVDG